MKNKKAIIQDIIKNPEEINIPTALAQYEIEISEIPASLYRNKKVAQYYCEEDMENLKDFTFFQDDEDFINNLINNDPFISAKALKYASKRIQALDYIVENACLHDGEALIYAHPKYYANENMVKVAFGTSDRINNKDWALVNKSIALDKEFVFSLIRMNTSLYTQLDAVLQNDSKIVNKVLEKYNGYKLLVDSQKSVMKNMRLAAKKTGLCIQHFPKDILDNEEIMATFLIKHPGAIFWCGEKLKSSKEIAQIVCDNKLSPHPYSFFNEDVRKDKKIALISLKNDSKCISFLPDDIKKDTDFLKLLLSEKISVEILAAYPIEIRQDKDLMKNICTEHPQAIGYVEGNLKYSSDFIQYIIDTNILNKTSQGYEKIHNIKAIFKELKYKNTDLDIFKVFVDNIKQISPANQLNYNVQKLFEHLPKENLHPALISEKALENFHTMLLEAKLSKDLDSKEKKVKVKI